MLKRLFLLVFVLFPIASLGSYPTEEQFGTLPKSGFNKDPRGLFPVKLDAPNHNVIIPESQQMNSVMDSIFALGDAPKVCFLVAAHTSLASAGKVMFGLSAKGGPFYVSWGDDTYSTINRSDTKLNFYTHDYPSECPSYLSNSNKWYCESAETSGYRANIKLTEVCITCPGPSAVTAYSDVYKYYTDGSGVTVKIPTPTLIISDYYMGRQILWEDAGVPNHSKDPLEPGSSYNIGGLDNNYDATKGAHVLQVKIQHLNKMFPKLGDNSPASQVPSFAGMLIGNKFLGTNPGYKDKNGNNILSVTPSSSLGHGFADINYTRAGQYAYAFAGSGVKDVYDTGVESVVGDTREWLFAGTFSDCPLESVNNFGFHVGSLNGLNKAPRKGLFYETFDGSKASGYIGSQLFENISGTIADYSFARTFANMPNLGVGSSGSTDLNYFIPTNLFAKISNNTSTGVTDGMKDIFKTSSKLPTVCPKGYGKYISKWSINWDISSSSSAISCEPCGAGKYSDEESANACKECDFGTYAVADRPQVWNDLYQTVVIAHESCTACPAAYPNTFKGAISKEKCYAKVKYYVEGDGNLKHEDHIFYNDSNKTSYKISSLWTPTAGVIQEGYKFIGWHKIDNNKLITEDDTFSGNTSLYARIDPIPYVWVELMQQGSTFKQVVGGTYTIESDDIVLPDIDKPGYDFKGWCGPYGSLEEIQNGAKNCSENATNFIPPKISDTEPVAIPKGSTGEKAFLALCPIIEYNYYGYAKFGSDWVQGFNNQYTVESDNIVLANWSKKGYTFKGWCGPYDTYAAMQNDANNCSEESDKFIGLRQSDVAPVAIPAQSTGNKYFYAWFEPITYTVSFEKNANNATGYRAPKTCTYGVECSIAGSATDIAFKKSNGEVPFGWSIVEEISGYEDIYTDNDTVLNLAFVNSQIVPLYAQWLKRGEKLCPAGMYYKHNSQEDNKCTSCPQNYWCPGTKYRDQDDEDTGIIRCPSGYETEGTGSVRRQDCFKIVNTTCEQAIGTLGGIQNGSLSYANNTNVQCKQYAAKAKSGDSVEPCKLITSNDDPKCNVNVTCNAGYSFDISNDTCRKNPSCTPGYYIKKGKQNCDTKCKKGYFCTGNTDQDESVWASDEGIGIQKCNASFPESEQKSDEEKDCYALVEFDTNGGTPETIAPVKKYYDPNDPVGYYNIGTEKMPPDPTNADGITFVGWVIYKPDGGSLNSINANTTLYGNNKLVAKWNNQTYKVIFDPHGGSLSNNSINSTICPMNADCVLPASVVKRNNYECDGWQLPANAGVLLQGNSGIVNKLHMTYYPANGEVTVYAHWVPVCSSNKYLHIGTDEPDKNKMCLYQELTGSPKLAVMIGNDKYYTNMSLATSGHTISETSDKKLHVMYNNKIYNVHDLTGKAATIYISPSDSSTYSGTASSGTTHTDTGGISGGPLCIAGVSCE